MIGKAAHQYCIGNMAGRRFFSMSAIQLQFRQTERRWTIEQILYISSIIGVSPRQTNIKCSAERKADERQRLFYGNSLPIVSYYWLHMIRLKLLILPILIVCIFSCKSEKENTYAIKDFRKSLQPFLNKIVTLGIVTYHGSSQTKSITDNETVLKIRQLIKYTGSQQLITTLHVKQGNKITLVHINDIYFFSCC